MRFKVRLSILFILFFVLLFGCTTSDTTSVEPHELIQSLRGSSVLVNDLVAGDTLELSVEVDGAMEVMQHRAELNHLGMVTLPLVGDVRVGGMKIDAAKRLISKTYSSYYVNQPVVMVALLDDGELGEWGAITVLGKVNSPGRIELRSSNGIKLTEAIQEAGGFSGSAKKSDIRVSRVDSNGKKIRASVNYERIGLDGNSDADIKLIDGDIVYIPERVF